MKNIRFFYLKIFSFLEMKFSIYLNRCVFVMNTTRILKLCLTYGEMFILKGYDTLSREATVKIDFTYSKKALRKQAYSNI